MRDLLRNLQWPGRRPSRRPSARRSGMGEARYGMPVRRLDTPRGDVSRPRTSRPRPAISTRGLGLIVADLLAGAQRFEAFTTGMLIVSADPNDLALKVPLEINGVRFLFDTDLAVSKLYGLVDEAGTHSPSTWRKITHSLSTCPTIGYPAVPGGISQSGLSPALAPAAAWQGPRGERHRGELPFGPGRQHPWVGAAGAAHGEAWDCRRGPPQPCGRGPPVLLQHHVPRQPVRPEHRGGTTVARPHP